MNKYVASTRITLFNLIFVIIIAIIFSYYFLNFDGLNKGYWDTYIIVPGLFMCNQPVDFVSLEGNRLYDYKLEGKLPQNLVGKDTYGVITKDQRIGSAITLAMPFLLFKYIGFRSFYALFQVLLFILGYFIGQNLFKNRLLSLLSGLILSFNTYIICIDRLNPNMVALTLIGLIYYILLKEECFPMFILGLLFGILLGHRYEAILFLPALIFWIFPSFTKIRNSVLFLLGVIIAILPILYWNKFAFGKFLIHPSQFSGFEGWRPVFPHRFLFLKFDFNGLLNFPFYTRIIRTPHFPFPVFLFIPLVIIRCFGLFLSSISILGINYLLKEEKRLAIFLLLWFIPFLLLICVQENWEELKLTFILLIFLPLVIFIISGLKFLFEKGKFRSNLIKLSGIVFFLFLFVNVSFYLDFPPDERWYLRFPNAKESKSGLGTLPEAKRWDWEFFQTRESREEIRYLKRKFTMANILPQFYSLRPKKLSQQLKTIRTELSQDRLKVFTIWEYIYIIK